MTTKLHEYQSEFVRKYVFRGRAEGRVEGEAQSVITVLEARALPITDDERTRIAECRDPQQLDTWLRRAITVDTVGALFA